MTDLPNVKLKTLVSFPATVLDGTGIDIAKSNGTYQFNLDFGDFAPPTVISNLSNLNALLWNSSTGQYTLATAASLTGTGGGAPAGGNLPVMNGVAAVGVATPYSREDHVHPSDTSRAATAYVDAQDALRAPLASPVLTGNPTAPTQAPGDNSTKIATTAYADASATAAVATAAAAVPILRDYIAGLMLSTSGPSTSFTVAAGMAVDGTNVNLMTLASALTKTTAAWVVGTGNGGLDTGAIANNTWYHVHMIKRPDTNVVDTCVSLSVTTPSTGGAIPTAYTRFRRIGSMKTNGSGQWTLFTQFNDRFRWSVPVLDVSNATITAYTNTVVSSPTGVQCVAFGNVTVSGGALTNIRPVGAADGAPATTASPLGTAGSGSAPAIFTSWRELTDTSAQISIGGLTGTGTYLTTAGWEDYRGKNA